MKRTTSIESIFRPLSECNVQSALTNEDFKATNKTLSLWRFISQVIESTYLADNHSKILLKQSESGHKVSIITPQTLPDGTRFMPWGGDNLMPYHIQEMVEKDETLSTCQMFNAEVCYGSRLIYNSNNCTATIKQMIEDFLLSNPLPSYFLGVCHDFKHFGWCVSVIILDNEGKRIVALHRKEVCYCRFSPADDKGRIEYFLYANWNKSISSVKEVEKIPLLSMDSPWPDLMQRMQNKNAPRKFAVVSRVPTPDSTYYPIPYYAALFKGKWYNIKQLIGMAKEAKLKNSAPLKYHIEVSSRYWVSGKAFSSENVLPTPASNKTAS